MIPSVKGDLPLDCILPTPPVALPPITMDHNNPPVTPHHFSMSDYLVQIGDSRTGDDALHGRHDASMSDTNALVARNDVFNTPTMVPITTGCTRVSDTVPWLTKQEQTDIAINCINEHLRGRPLIQLQQLVAASSAPGFILTVIAEDAGGADAAAVVQQASAAEAERGMHMQVDAQQYNPTIDPVQLSDHAQNTICPGHLVTLCPHSNLYKSQSPDSSAICGKERLRQRCLRPRPKSPQWCTEASTRVGAARQAAAACRTALCLQNALEPPAETAGPVNEEIYFGDDGTEHVPITGMMPYIDLHPCSPSAPSQKPPKALPELKKEHIIEVEYKCPNNGASKQDDSHTSLPYPCHRRATSTSPSTPSISPSKRREGSCRILDGKTEEQVPVGYRSQPHSPPGRPGSGR